MTGARWLATARAAHTRAMGAPQRFPLFGDGAETHRAMTAAPSIDSNGDSLIGAALAEARYLDGDFNDEKARLDLLVQVRFYLPSGRKATRMA